MTYRGGLVAFWVAIPFTSTCIQGSAVFMVWQAYLQKRVCIEISFRQPSGPKSKFLIRNYAFEILYFGFSKKDNPQGLSLLKIHAYNFVSYIAKYNKTTVFLYRISVTGFAFRQPSGTKSSF